MEDLNRLCMGCMIEKPGTGICPYCHFAIEKYKTPLYHLKPQTILSGKYLVGKSIGEGGFGITYIGWDLNLEIPLAIKEYFPNGFAIRDHHTSDHVTAFTGEKEKFYKAGREKFIQEAKSLAKFYKQEEIVLVRDYFQENGTAYIVMEYIVGKSYSEILKEKEKNNIHPSVEEVFETMKPVIKALEMVHNEGIIHRDISPDNIMITEDGVIKLIDFGAARGFSDGEKSLSIVLKAGYAPEEQYQTKGNQGPWTDVYAFCATIYRAITGRKPPDSMERLAEDTIKKPSELGIQMDEELEKALMKGLAVREKDRWQSMRELYRAFYERQKEERNSIHISSRSLNTIPEQNFQQKQEKTNKKIKNSDNQKIILSSLIFIVVILVGGIMIKTLYNSNKKLQDKLDYIFPYSNTRYLDESDLEGISKEDIRIGKNEIYARYGRKFTTKSLQEYFDSKDWYEGTVEPKDDSQIEERLNDYEKANIKFLQQHQ
ncbi:MAG: YARHG domain-containing protein [Lachnospiraceae bacterium]